MRCNKALLLTTLPLLLLLTAACSSTPSPPATVASVPTVVVPSPAPSSTGLLLPATSTVTGSATARPGTYTVKAGDTLFAIAAAQGVSVSAIIAANPTVTPDAIQVGLQLIIPSATPTTVSPLATAASSTASATAVSPTATATP